MANERQKRYFRTDRGRTIRSKANRTYAHTEKGKIALKRARDKYRRTI